MNSDASDGVSNGVDHGASLAVERARAPMSACTEELLFSNEAPAPLRPYQQFAIEQLDVAVAAGSTAPLLVLPTGSGKTVIAAHLMHRAVGRRQRALFLAPRRELVAQT